MEDQNSLKCVICGTTEQLLRCVKCKSAFYCSSVHQHTDWPRHKSECRTLAKELKKQQLQQAVEATSLGTSPKTTIRAAAATLKNGGDGSNYLKKGRVQPEHALKGTNHKGIMSTEAQICNASNNLDGEYHQAQHHHIDMQDANTHMQQMHIGENVENNSDVLQQKNIVEQQLETEIVTKTMELAPQFSSHANNQLEKVTSYQIGRLDQSLMENVNERCYDDLCLNIINDMNEYGLSVVDDFLGLEKGLQILKEVHGMHTAGVFKDGQLVSNARPEQNLKTIRGDKTTWVKGTEPGCSNVGYLINQIDNVICHANAMKNNGKLGQYQIKERTKAMVACYPGSGSHYVMHVDNPNKDGRVITAIYYLNLNWNTTESGGLLRIFPEHGNAIADIEPIFDRLIFFWSDKRNPHEVQPAHRTRYAITVWYFDANEREAALNRCKYFKKTEILPTTTTITTNASAVETSANMNKTATKRIENINNAKAVNKHLAALTVKTTTNTIGTSKIST